MGQSALWKNLPYTKHLSNVPHTFYSYLAAIYRYVMFGKNWEHNNDIKEVIKKKGFFIPSAEAIELQQEEYRYEKVWFQILSLLCLSHWQIMSLSISCKKEKSELGQNGEIFEMFSTILPIFPSSLVELAFFLISDFKLPSPFIYILNLAKYVWQSQCLLNIPFCPLSVPAVLTV